MTASWNGELRFRLGRAICIEAVACLILFRLYNGQLSYCYGYSPNLPKASQLWTSNSRRSSVA